MKNKKSDRQNAPLVAAITPSAAPMLSVLGLYLDYFDRVYGGGITVNELRVMRAIHSARLGMAPCGCKHGATVSCLAEQTEISKQTVSRAVTSLTARGFLGETVPDCDGRRRVIHQTQKYLDIFNREHAAIAAFALASYVSEAQ